MKKKMVLLFVVMAMVLSVVGCANDTPNDYANPEKEKNEVAKEKSELEQKMEEAKRMAKQDETTVVILKPKVDPRVLEEKSDILVGFINLDTRRDYETNLQAQDNYTAVLYVQPGEYAIFKGCVAGDYKFEYGIENAHFTTEDGKETEVEFAVGDPNYCGEIEEYLEGDINREETNQLLEEDGKSPIDWDKYD